MQQQVTPVGWEWLGVAFALLPLMLLIMMMRAVDKLLETETGKEVAKEVVTRRLLPGGK